VRVLVKDRRGATHVSAMLVSSIALGTAALDAAMLPEVTGLAGVDAHGADAYGGPASPRHWSLDEILWNPDALAATAAPQGSVGGGTLRPASLAAVPEPKAVPRRRTQQSSTCSALGCSEALYALGAYYMRNRLCPAHLRAEQLWLTQEGSPLRFCQVRCRKPLCNARQRLVAPHSRPASHSRYMHCGADDFPFINPVRRSATGAMILALSTA